MRSKFVKRSSKTSISSSRTSPLRHSSGKPAATHAHAVTDTGTATPKKIAVNDGTKNKEVGAYEAAYELGLRDAVRLKSAINDNPRLVALGLLPLARGNTIKREVWETTDFVYSPFQEAAQEMKLGTAVRPR